MAALVSRRMAAIIRRRGRNGLKNAKLRLIPNRENGNKRHTGHSSASAPSDPPMPVAPFVPMGHPPVFFLQWSSPALRERSIIRKIVNTISPEVGAGLGGPGICGIIPSSHIKKREQKSATPQVQYQNDRLCKNCNCIVAIMSCAFRSCQGSLQSSHPMHIREKSHSFHSCTLVLPQQDTPTQQTLCPVVRRRRCSPL